MHYIIPINRQQITFGSLEEKVAADNPVRFIDAFVDTLDLSKLGFVCTTLKSEGRPPFHPKVFLKLYLYSYQNGLRSSRKMAKECSSTVEPVLGTLLNFLGMRRVNARGIKQANKHVMMAALTYNLKKYLRFISRKSVATLQALEQSALNSLKNCTPTLFTLVLCITVHYRKQAYRLYSPW